MTPDRQTRIEALFKAALERPEAERELFLRGACSDDAVLHNEVRALLAADSSARGFLEAPRIRRRSLSTLEAGEDIGRYKIVRVIDAGGIGVVYEAAQDRPNRRVALKVIRPDLSNDAALKRFIYEPEILARLHHPNIAQVYDAGTMANGRTTIPYFAMEYIENARPLTAYADQHELNMHQRLELFAQVCDAVHYGHQRGIIHRDLKPSNILVDREGRPKVIDFGVARVTDADITVATLQTEVGQLVGTLRYMSPEQCAGDAAEIDTRSDVYTLGVVLYELLTGEMPYDMSSCSPLDIPRLIREQDVCRPSVIRDGLRGDVETIILKALEKDRTRRYRSAEALGADLENSLSNRPIKAKRESVLYALRKTIQRHRIIFSLAAALFAVAVGASIALSTLYIQAEASRRLSDANAYRASLRAATAGLLPNDAATAQASLELAPPELRGWEWHYLSRIADESVRTLNEQDVPWGVSWSPDGEHLVSGAFDRTLRVWNVKSGESLWTLTGHNDIVFDVAWSPDGSIIASGSRDRTVRLWDATTGALLHQLSAPERVTDVDFSPDGRRVAAAASYSNLAVLYDVDSGEEVLQLPPHPPKVECVAFSPDGRQIATGSLEYGGGQGETTIRIHDADSGIQIEELQSGSWGVRELEFSPDGRRLAAATANDSIRIWNLGDLAAEPIRLSGIGRKLNDLKFFSDGRQLISVGFDNLIHVSDSHTGKHLDSFRGHRNRVGRVALSPDERSAATSSADGTIKIWNLEVHPGRHILTGHNHGVDCVTFSPDGRFLLSGSRDTTIRIWDTTSWESVRVLEQHPASVSTLAFSSDGSMLASGNLNRNIEGPEGAIYLWDRQWRPRLLSANMEGVRKLAFSPDGGELAATFRDNGPVRVWDVRSGHQIPVPRLPADSLGLVYSHSGRYLVSLTMNGTAIFNGTTHELEANLYVPHSDRRRFPTDAAFSAGETYLAVAAKTGITTVWRTDTWEEVCRIGQLDDPEPSTVIFSPDASRLVIGHATGVTIVDVNTWSVLLTFRDVTDVYRVAFSPDGNHLAAGSSDGTIRVWSAHSDTDDSL